MITREQRFTYYSAAHWLKMRNAAFDYIRNLDDRKVISWQYKHNAIESAIALWQKYERLYMRMAGANGLLDSHSKTPRPMLKKNRDTIINGVNFTAMCEDAKGDLHKKIDEYRRYIDAFDKIKNLLDKIRYAMKSGEAFEDDAAKYLQFKGRAKRKTRPNDYFHDYYIPDPSRMKPLLQPGSVICVSDFIDMQIADTNHKDISDFYRNVGQYNQA